MNIVINAVGWSSLIKGVDRYTIELIRHLAQIDASNHYYIYHGAWQKDYPVVKQDNFRFIRVNWSRNRFLRHIWHGVIFPFLARHHKPDIIHLPNTMAYFFKAGNTIATIHDQLLEFSYPEKYGSFRSLARRKIVRMQTSKCSRVIAVSPSVKKVLEEKLSINPGKIDVILEGVNTDVYNPGLRGAVPFRINKPYILFVSVIDKNKNLSVLINAYDALPEKLKNEYLLVVAGKKGNAADDIGRMIWERSLSRNVIFLGHVGNELPALYANAELFVMPSIYEGFSLPVLEAMASGAPVVMSKTIALADFVKEYTVQFDPQDTDELKDAIASLLINRTLRDDLVKRAIKGIQGFAWSAAAEATLQCYGDLIRN